MPNAAMLSASPPLRSWSREKKRFILAAGHTAHGFGLGRQVGRCYALLILAARPLCLDEMAQGLSISKASASIALRRLAAWKLVQRVPVEEVRRDYYRIDANFARVIREGLLPMAQGKLASAGVMLDAMLRSAPVPAVNTDQGSTGSLADSVDVRQLLQEAKALQEKLSLILNSGVAARFF
jgi:DNA-binding transcriptional regulator GbsR (MarR family)